MSEHDEAIQHRRRFPRFEVAFPLEVDGTKCEIREVSFTSFRFTSEEPLTAGMTKKATIRTVDKNGEEKSVETNVHIHWCEPLGNGGGYMAGAEIWDLGGEK